MWQPFRYLKMVIYLLSPLSQAKHTQLLQAFLIRLSFQTPDHLGLPPLHMFQLFNILLKLWCPELNTGLQMWSEQGRIECLDLDTIILLMQPRIALAFFAAASHC
ncbi:Hypothetical predicted protein [Podarcis lilfordi]|uniref:Uncharacterized protein n=1 Tax=Podarcis lilfordi TaxID=74358 RepID=A0AA35LBA2_9SAUR|nr:Hypothetical predicted protein [Podarcis lilfordi]